MIYDGQGLRGRSHRWLNNKDKSVTWNNISYQVLIPKSWVVERLYAGSIPITSCWCRSLCQGQASLYIRPLAQTKKELHRWMHDQSCQAFLLFLHPTNPKEFLKVSAFWRAEVAINEYQFHLSSSSSQLFLSPVSQTIQLTRCSNVTLPILFCTLFQMTSVCPPPSKG